MLHDLRCSSLELTDAARYSNVPIFNALVLQTGFAFVCFGFKHACRGDDGRSYVSVVRCCDVPAACYSSASTFKHDDQSALPLCEVAVGRFLVGLCWLRSFKYARIVELFIWAANAALVGWKARSIYMLVKHLLQPAASARCMLCSQSCQLFC